MTDALRGHLEALLGHHVWATRALLDRCLELSPAELELATPGGYGSIRATLAHTVRADGRYLDRLLGRPRPAARLEDEPEPAALVAEVEAQARLWSQVVEGLEGIDLTLPAEPDEDPPYPEIPHAAAVVLVQAIHHGNEHRAHACSILGAHGLRVPDLSGWEYGRLRHLGEC